MVEMELPEITDKQMDEDLKTIRIVSKLEAKWTDARDKAKEAIQIDTMNIEISHAIIKIANHWIKSERAMEKERLK